MKEKVMKAYEKSIALNAKLNHLVTPIDPSEQLAHVKQGKLSYMAIGVKDNISTKGIKTTASSRILDNYVPVYDATVIEKLKDAGAILIAKTSMDELGMGGTNLNAYTGPVHNPYDLQRISGGSSGGSAVMVASGIVDVALGTDTGDSVRKPASFCGVVGVKPSYGRISRYGVIPYASSLDHIGYFASDVKTAATFLGCVAGRDLKDMTSSEKPVLEYEKLLNSDLSGKTIGVFQEVLDLIDNPKVLEAFSCLIEKLKEKGAIIKPFSVDKKLLRALLPTYYMIANCEATSNHANLDGIRFGVRETGSNAVETMIASRTNGFSSQVKMRFLIGGFGLLKENQEKIFKKAQRVRRLIVEAVLKQLETVDCFIAPASNNIAPLIDSKQETTYDDKTLIIENHMVIGNFAGLPSMTVPLTFDKNCPIGVNITCKAFDEMTMFDVGLAIEEITGLHHLVAEVK